MAVRGFWLWTLVFSIVLLTILLCYVLYRMKMLKASYKDKHVLITGGSSGIGLATAIKYVQKGANVTIVARNEKTLADARKILLKCNNCVGKIETVAVDLSKDQNNIANKFQEAINKLGEIDVLINCAGTSVTGEFEMIDVDEFRKMFDINVMSAVHATRVVVKSMKQRQSGKIIFVSSQIAQAAIHSYTAYAASKWALRGIAEALQSELKPYNISVSISFPPDTDTPGYKTEMLTKSSLTHKISSLTSTVHNADEIAQDIIDQSTMNYYHITTGVDGWLLSVIHAGMTPVNNGFEVLFQIMFASIGRFISIFFVLFIDYLCFEHTRNERESNKPTKGTEKNENKKEN